MVRDVASLLYSLFLLFFSASAYPANSTTSIFRPSEDYRNWTSPICIEPSSSERLITFQDCTWALGRFISAHQQEEYKISNSPWQTDRDYIVMPSLFIHKSCSLEFFFDKESNPVVRTGNLVLAAIQVVHECVSQINANGGRSAVITSVQGTVVEVTVSAPQKVGLTESAANGTVMASKPRNNITDFRF